MTKQTKLMIGTPAYNGYLHTEYLHSVLAFKTMGIDFSVQTIGNESLITRARNTILAKFWLMEEYTHLLFLDADVFLDVDGLLNMLYYDKDVIGAPVALKGKNPDGSAQLNTDANPELEIKLQSVNRVGTAVFMLSRNAIGALIDDAIKNGRSYLQTVSRDPQHSGEIHYDVFQVGVSDNIYLSEDFFVCDRLKQLGFEIFVDTSIYTRHTGVVVFD